jgi:hypothetical protein
MLIKIDRLIRFCSFFLKQLGIDDGQKKRDTADLSATYVSWNPGQQLKLSILNSLFDIRRLPN